MNHSFEPRSLWPNIIHKAILFGLVAITVSGCNIGRMGFRLNTRGAGGETVVSESSPATEATLDESFGNKGRLVLSPGNRWDLSGGLAVQSNGKYIVAGSTHNRDAKAEHFDVILARIDSAGNLDHSFGNNSSGFARHEFSPGNGRGGSVRAVKVVANDEIIIAGEWDSLTQGANIFVAQFSSQGVMKWIRDDINFTCEGSASCHDYATSIAVDASKRILIGGYSSASKVDANSSTSGRTRMVAVRLAPVDAQLSSYVLDSAFNGSGKTAIEFNVDGNSVANAISIQGEKIILAGYVRAGTHSNMAMARLGANGTLDSSFGSAGTVSFDASSLAKDDVAASVLILSDNRILLGGHSSNGSDSDMALARFKADGALDSTFGTNGRILYNISFSDYMTGMALVSGKILMTGYSQKGIHFEFAALRVTGEGAVEGKVFVEFPSTSGVNATAYARGALPVGETGALILGEGYFGATSQFDLALAKVKAM